MLVLSRKLMERIQIGDNVFITVLKIGRNRVRLGIEAPKEAPVLRSELRDVSSKLLTGFVPAAV